MEKKTKAKKTEKVTEPMTFMQLLVRVYGRYQLIYGSVVILSVIAIAAIWFLTNNFWGATSLAFGFWSWNWFVDGTMKGCTDDKKYYEQGNTENGLNQMCNSWPWFAGLVVIAYFLCKTYIPELFN